MQVVNVSALDEGLEFEVSDLKVKREEIINVLLTWKYELIRKAMSQ